MANNPQGHLGKIDPAGHETEPPTNRGGQDRSLGKIGESGSRLAHTAERAAQRIGQIAEKVQHGIERAVTKVEDRTVHMFKGR